MGWKTASLTMSYHFYNGGWGTGKGYSGYNGSSNTMMAYTFTTPSSVGIDDYQYLDLELDAYCYRTGTTTVRWKIIKGDYDTSITPSNISSKTGIDSGYWEWSGYPTQYHVYEPSTNSTTFSASTKYTLYTYGTKSSDGLYYIGKGSTFSCTFNYYVSDKVTVYVSDWDNTSGSAIRKKWDSKQFTPGVSVDAGTEWGTEPPSDDYEYVDSDSCTAYEGAIAWRNFKQKPKYVTVYVNDYCWNTGGYIREKWSSDSFLEGSEVKGDHWGTEPPSDIYVYDSCDTLKSAYEGATVDRNFNYASFNVTCIDYDDAGTQIATQSAKSYTYGSTAKGSDWGTTAPTGYTYSTCSSVTVTGDTEVTRTFNRNSYTVYEYDVIDSTTGTVLGQNTGSFKYKEEVRGSDISSATYAGYHYIEDTSCEVSTTASNNKVYRIFNANEYMLEYDLGPGAEEEPLPRSATYNQWLKIPDPVRLGYELEGWNLSGMSYDTHYYSPDGSTKHSFTGSTASKIYGPYFMNLTSDENGTVYLEAVWKAKGLGRIYLESDKKYHSALCFIYHDGKYYQAIPYIYHDGKYRIGG